PHALAEARRLSQTSYAWLEQHLADGRPWAAGQDFSMADCGAAPFLFYADWSHPIPAGCTRVHAYRARLLARPSMRRAVDEARPYRHLLSPRRAGPRLAASGGCGIAGCCTAAGLRPEAMLAFTSTLRGASAMTQRRRQASIRTRSILAAALVAALPSALAEPLKLNEQEYFSRPGLDVLVFNNYYDGLFSDAKHAGVELIHHGVRTATNGDVRLSPTPEQWDPVAQLVERKVDARTGTVTTRMGYPNEKFEYSIQVSPQGDGVR